MNMYQSTIKTAVTVAGVGLHTGNEVKMTFKPAPTNHGVKFKRIDLEGQPEIKADVDYVVDISRGTTLEQNGARISTIEHVMAALAGLQIDNVLIELDGVETPIMDGSSKVFIEALYNAGIDNQKVKREIYTLRKQIVYRDEERDVEIMAVPADNYAVAVMIDYNSKVLGQQHASFSDISEFKDGFASSRTFCFLHELEMLLNNDLIKGGDLNNAIVVVDKTVDNKELGRLAALFNKPTVEVKKEGILNNVELRYQNEPARHKLLDVVGDLSLIGMPIRAKIVATRPGHAANIEFAKKVKAEIKKNGTMAPIYDPNHTPEKDINVIRKFLPHKYPFLLVDKIIELDQHRVVGLKNVTFNEQFFQGHFPEEPVMPGVLIIEAMAQTGGILVMNTVPDPENYSTYLLKISKARFKNKVVPGDTLLLQMEFISPIRRGICEMKGTAFVGDKIAVEAELVAKIAKKEE